VMRGCMPPFPGNVEEARAVAYFLHNATFPEEPSPKGRSVFKRRCAPCHTLSGPFRPLAAALKGSSASDVKDTVTMMGADDGPMPVWSGSAAELDALGDYLATELVGGGDR